MKILIEKKWSDKYKKSIDCDNPKGFSQKAHCAGRKKNEGKDPKKGTGKKPKGSGRRLYTDEDPSDTVSVKFSTVQDIKDTLSKSSFKSKSHKRQSQIINLIHQRARAAYQNAKDPKVKARLKKSFEYAKKRKEASKRKTQRMKKESISIDEMILEELENVLIEKAFDQILDEKGGKCQKGYKTHPTRKTKQMYGKTYRNCVKAEEKELSDEDILITHCNHLGNVLLLLNIVFLLSYLPLNL
jgi:signal recognition particle GTPase